jgi:quinol monooxygenase YgiN
MTQPLVFISRNKIKEGRRDDFREHYAASVPVTSAEKPGTLAQLTYENEDGTQVTVVRLFPDAAALDLQIQGQTTGPGRPMSSSSR